MSEDNKTGRRWISSIVGLRDCFWMRTIYIRMRNIGLTFLFVSSLASGCAYHGVVAPKSVFAVTGKDKIDADVFYKGGSSALKPIQIAQGPTTYHIEVGNATDVEFRELLSARFKQVSEQNRLEAEARETAQQRERMSEAGGQLLASAFGFLAQLIPHL